MRGWNAQYVCTLSPALSRQGRGGTPGADEAARDARRAVEAKEGDDGYLRRARVALAWTERLAREVRRQGPRYGPPVAWAVRLAADATRTLAEHETPCRPGVILAPDAGVETQHAPDKSGGQM